MDYITYADLDEKERLLVDKAFEAVNHSEAPLGHKIGLVIFCENSQIFQSATNIRSRAIGSTCAESIAVDQMFYYGNKHPKLVVNGIISES